MGSVRSLSVAVSAPREALQTANLSSSKIVADSLTGNCRREAAEDGAFALCLLAIQKIPNFRVSLEFHSRQIPADIKAQ
jgi:hypothetical protein